MQKYFTQEVEKFLLELRNSQMEKAIHLLVEFIKQNKGLFARSVKSDSNITRTLVLRFLPHE